MEQPTERSRRRSSTTGTKKGPLSGQIALVTGATGGIGTSICRILAENGASIGIHYKDDQDTAISLLEELKEVCMHVYGSKFVTYKADLGNYEEVSPSSSYMLIILNHTCTRLKNYMSTLHTTSARPPF